MNLVSLLIAPLQAVVLFFAPHAPAVKPASARLPVRTLATAAGNTDTRVVAQRAGVSRSAQVGYPASSPYATAKPSHPVRMVRNVDTSLPPDRAGRMVVSGRFADVCAELDRLVAMEMRAA
jgi:hypothetical protein